ncbi:MAG: hypothetical protein KL787_10860 [Taibaiella sp.]|nr:hypothetical protein [Taibaiella sp.]
MQLSALKALLPTLNHMRFQLESGTGVPENIHITEVGCITKDFIDCGGTIRQEKVVSLQLWNANDYDHRLHPGKLLKIIALSEQQLQMEDAEIEVEYQRETIGKYALSFDGTNFILHNKTTACLAGDQCGIPQQKQKVNLSELQTLPSSCCTPDSGCC